MLVGQGYVVAYPACDWIHVETDQETCKVCVVGDRGETCVVADRRGDAQCLRLNSGGCDLPP